MIAPVLQTLFWMLYLVAVHANASFKALLKALHLFSDMPLYSHIWSRGSYINYYEIMNIFYTKINFNENQAFIENFILQKFGAIQYTATC